MAQKSLNPGMSEAVPVEKSAANAAKDVPGHGPISDVMPWVARWLAPLPPGASVLDLACGQGRHSQLAADAGHQVLAVDRNAEALAALAGKNTLIETLQADLEGAPWPFMERRFDAIVVTNYLFRERLSFLPTLLAPGGRLIYATFGLGNEQYGRPANPHFLLAPGELIRLAQRSGLVIAGFESGYTSVPKPAVIERICALRPDATNCLASIDPAL